MLALLGLLSACATSRSFSAGADVDKVVTLHVPENDTPAHHLVLHLTVGPLPARARLLIRYDDGDIAGSIAPYGRTQAASGGTYDVPIRRSAVRDGQVTLRLQADDRYNQVRRAPTADEVRSLELVTFE